MVLIGHFFSLRMVWKNSNKTGELTLNVVDDYSCCIAKLLYHILYLSGRMYFIEFALKKKKTCVINNCVMRQLFYKTNVALED